MLDDLGPNPIPNSNSKVGHQNQQTGQAMANPIPNPNTREPISDFLIDIHICWMNLDPIQYPIPIPMWGIKVNIPAKLWAYPIPNPNSGEPISDFVIDKHAG